MNAAELPYSRVVLKYLDGYGPDVQARVQELISQARLGEYLGNRYNETHEVRNDKMLLQAALELKDRYLRTSAPLSKVRYDSRLKVISHALGTHTRVSRVQGNQLRGSREIRIAALFRDAPAEFLRMILVHELAHLKEGDHNKAFYQLCVHMAPNYFQLEFDLRLYLILLECRAAKVETALTGEP